jgi:hypothetical protein
MTFSPTFFPINFPQSVSDKSVLPSESFDLKQRNEFLAAENASLRQQRESVFPSVLLFDEWIEQQSIDKANRIVLFPRLRELQCLSLFSQRNPCFSSYRRALSNKKNSVFSTHRD